MRDFSGRTTLSTRPGYGGNGNSTTTKPRSGAKGHDAILKGLQDASGVIKIVTTGGRIYKGSVVNRDRWTITLNTPEEKAVTIYKSAIEAFIPQGAA